MTETQITNSLRALGLSQSGLLRSTGIDRHLARLKAGEITPDTLNQYAADLGTLTSGSSANIPANFWDVRSPAMTAANLTEYVLVGRLAAPNLSPYRSLLGQAYGSFTALQSGQITALAAALDILRVVTAYVHAGNPLPMTETMPGLNPEQNALFLWQQVLTGANRAVPVLGEFYTHGIWEHFNVVEMQRYALGRDLDPNAAWGITGFAPAFIGHPRNNNQVEHMAISAISSTILRVPLLALNLFEIASWMPLRRAPYGEMRGDINLNNAVVYDLLPGFKVTNPEPAITRFAVAVG